MRTTSLDLRERILASYDHNEGTRAEIAHRFRVSLGLVKKLLQQRRRTGDLARRNLTKGQAAMLTAMMHPEAYSKKDSETKPFSRVRLSEARKVLKHSRKIAEAVGFYLTAGIYAAKNGECENANRLSSTPQPSRGIVICPYDGFSNS